MVLAASVSNLEVHNVPVFSSPRPKTLRWPSAIQTEAIYPLSFQDLGLALATVDLIINHLISLLVV